MTIKEYTGLNPCFSGGWSRRCTSPDYDEYGGTVLILVLVEDGLGDVRLKKL